MSPQEALAFEHFAKNFLCDSALVFGSFFLSYLITSTIVFNAAHGNAAAWENLRNKLIALLTPECVGRCIKINKVVLRPTITAADRSQLFNFVMHLEKIDRIMKRLGILRCRSRFFILAVIFAVVFGLLFSCPILFNDEPFSKKIPYFTTLIPILFSGAGYFSISHYHASAWSEIQDVTGKCTASLEQEEITSL